MKTIATIAVTAALVAGAAADLSNQHQHMHRHRHAARKVLEQRSDTVAYETAYVYANGESVSSEEAKACLADGECIVLGTSVPTVSSTSTTPTSTSTTAAATTSSTVQEAAVFIETTSSSSSATTFSTSTSATSTSTAAASTSSSTTSGSSSSFPNGTISCSTFPSDYGAVAVDWVGLDGWAGIQTTGSWTPGVDISDITEPTSGGCTSGSFCSYACSPGQSKAQWPTTSQGSTGQSIGGLWCNDDGYLELTNPNFDTLCADGLGGITIENKLSELVSVCATNYPGNEMMNVPTLVKAGGSNTLTNIDASTAYQWEGSYTSGQFYVNKKGVTLEEGCVWTSDDYPDSAGNWAPVNIGAGTDIYGITYISIFPNSPTSSATLDFDIVISGDISSECYLKDGSYYGSDSGCTTAMTSGGSVTITFQATGSS